LNREKKRSIERMSSITTLKRPLCTFFSETVERRRECEEKRKIISEEKKWIRR
jgi:hypothetical protein